MIFYDWILTDIPLQAGHDTHSTPHRGHLNHDLSIRSRPSWHERRILRDPPRPPRRIKRVCVGGCLQVDERIGRVEELLKAQSERFQDSQSIQPEPYYKAPPPYMRRRSSQGSNKAGGSPPTPRAESIGVRITRHITTCTRGCPCACHKQRRSSTPALLERIIGQIFVDYAGLPIFSQKCNIPTCTKGQSPHVRLEYWFPLGFVWSQIFHLQIVYLQNAGPQMQLNFLRRVLDSAPCIDFALFGNIDGLKDLFARGLASPRDVSNTRGYSVLRVSFILRLRLLYIRFPLSLTIV
jgi:hypothetical protein